MNDSTIKKTYRAVVFDMDGTIIESMLDFNKIRNEIGLDQSQGILEAIEEMSPDKARRAHEILISHEMTAARQAGLIPNARDIIDKLKTAGLKLALLTRNTQQAMVHVLERHQLQFDITWAREDGPIKPQPDGILKVCDLFDVKPDQLACVGDFYYDMVAANAAGSTSILLARDELPHYADTADIVIRDLNELAEILI